MVIASFTLIGLQLLIARASFITTPTYPTGSPQAVFVAMGDFNGDGILDVAVTNYFSNTVNMLLGNGDGTFQRAPFPQGLGQDSGVTKPRIVATWFLKRLRR